VRSPILCSGIVVLIVFAGGCGIMSGLIQVVPEDLHLSARFVNCHAADIQAQHAAAHAEIEGAQPGLVGLSAVAIAEKAAEWQGITQAFCARLADQSAAFSTSALAYRSTDGRNAEDIGAVGAEASHTMSG
jgi:hypothetical protein